MWTLLGFGANYTYAAPGLLYLYHFKSVLVVLNLDSFTSYVSVVYHQRLLQRAPYFSHLPGTEIVPNSVAYYFAAEHKPLSLRQPSCATVMLLMVAVASV